MQQFMSEAALNGSPVREPLARQMHAPAVEESAGHGIVIGPCRIGREDVYFPIENPDGKLGRQLLNAFFNYVRNRAL